MQAQASFRVQPEVADAQQRARVAIGALGQELLMAGAGPASTRLAGALVHHLPPIAPYRRGQIDDAARGVLYRPATVSVLSVPPTEAEAEVRSVVDLGREALVELAPNCGALVHERVCGFEVGMRVLLFDGRGAFDVATVIEVNEAVVRIEHDGALAAGAAGAVMAAVVAPTFFAKEDAATGALQLMRYDGFRTDRPVVDNVVDLRVELFADPRPPRHWPMVAAGDPSRPLTSYGPAPPPAGVDDGRDSWPAGENCVFARDADGAPVARVGEWRAGLALVAVEPAAVQDGPWCVDGIAGRRFDADLLRVRRVRVTVRVQVAVAAMRGPAGRLFLRPGSATTSGFFAPDQQLVLDVTPRNLGARP
jgi:hypothetical protein